MRFFADTLFVKEIHPGILGTVELICLEKGSILENHLTLPLGLVRELKIQPGDVIKVKCKDIDGLNSKPKWVKKDGQKLRLADFR